MYPHYRKIIGIALGLLVLAATLVFLHFRTERRVISISAASIVPPVSVPTAVVPQPLPPVPKPVAPVVDPVLPVGTDRFVVALSDTNDIVAQNLLSGGYISDADSFNTLLGTDAVAPGGYKISTSMTPAQLVTVLRGKPYMKWVVIPPGLRKEEIAVLLGNALGWTTKQENTFITKDTTKDPDYIEGVYFPDTYLIPVAENTVDVTNRLIAQFNESFTPLLPQFNAQNIKWTTGLTLASIVQREAANDADMPLIAGILWNRLNQGMALDVDATVQYARGNTGSGWWAPISPADEKIDSPYNTYIYKGLPPHPISNPGLPAIMAVLNPAQTDCLYYIHDNNRVIHCAATYPEQEANIQEYLVNQ